MRQGCYAKMKFFLLPDLFFCWCGLALNLALMGNVKANTRIVASAPVNPVDHGGILAVHCQVWNLGRNEEVMVLRTVNDKTDKLSGDGQDSDLDNRNFIAVRQMDDGSMVHFLSLTDVTKSDGGEYSCIVIRMSKEITQIATDTVHVSIVHFPSESNPKCESNNEKHTVFEGKPITLNCSSSTGNPPVQISWSQVGSTAKLPSTQIAVDGIVYAAITVRPKVGDPVYLCEIKSPAFPNQFEKCHIGPIKVIRNPDAPLVSTYITKNLPTTSTSLELTQRPRVVKSLKCRQMCASRTSEQLYWIIGTVFMAVLALLFFIIFVGLLLKYYRRLRNNNRTEYKVPYEQRSHKVYEELEIRQCGGQVYMALDKSKSTVRESTYTDEKVECLDNVTNEPIVLR